MRRSPNPFADVDTIEDKKLVSICQHLLTGKADISELDEVSYLALAADVPTKIVEATGKSSRGYILVCYGWNLYDVNYLFEGTQPSEAVPISEAGFTEDQLVLLAKEDSYLRYIRTLEKHNSNPKGYYFPVELEEKIKTTERRMAAKGKLTKLLVGLRGNSSAKTPASQAPKVSASLRNEVLQFHEYSCIFDGRSRPEFKMHAHHVIPQRVIKQLALPERLFSARENLFCACSGCNIVKSDKLTQADVRFYLAQFSNPIHPNYLLIKFLEKFRELHNES